jgi:1,4-alpha-glucan branching enzyme
MPYVEGYGSWPFGEEWLWEAMATSYLPLLDVLSGGPELTLSLTPVLCDQLAAPGLGERFLAFLSNTRVATHELDAAGCRAGGRDDLAAEIERSALDYVRAGERFASLDGDLLSALGRHAAWTSSATHAVLPLLATDAGVRLQLETGIESHRERFGAWRGGLWSPECAHAPWLDPLLEAAGVRATCIERSDVPVGAPEHLQPLRSQAGPLLVPIDRQIMELVWSDRGYPSKGPYRDSHERTTHHHKPWRCDGGVYDVDDAQEQVARDAADLVARVEERIADGGLCVCALDTELLGHWWYEGPAWLRAVVEECRRRDVELVHLDDALDAVEPETAPDLGVTTWGRGRDLSTWSGPAVADLAWRARAAELRALSARHDLDTAAVRELLALQSSDWAFVISEHLAEPYGRERADGHFAALTGPAGAAGPRSLAPHAKPAPLLAP